MSQLIFINSSCRISGSINDSEIIIPNEMLTYNNNTEYATLSLINFTTKQSYYNISSNRNSRFYYSDNGVEYLITIPDGNYNVKELASKIELLINQISTIVWSISVNMNTLKYKFEYIGSPLNIIYFKPYSLTTTEFKILGFIKPITYKQITDIITYSDNIVSIGNEPAIYIHSDFSNSNKALSGTSVDIYPIFAKINIYSAGFFGLIIYEKTNYTFSVKIPDINSNKIKFSLTDSDSNLLDFSDDYDMILELNIHQKKKFEIEDLGKLLATKMLLK